MGGHGEKEASGMRIRARCLSCDRDLLLDQLTEGRAACPWCGTAVADDYVPLFVDAIRDAERAGATLLDALELLRDTGRGVRVDPGSIVEPIRKALGPTEEEPGERSPARRLRDAA